MNYRSVVHVVHFTQEAWTGREIIVLLPESDWYFVTFPTRSNEARIQELIPAQFEV